MGSLNVSRTVWCGVVCACTSIVSAQQAVPRLQAVAPVQERLSDFLMVRLTLGTVASETRDRRPALRRLGVQHDATPDRISELLAAAGIKAFASPMITMPADPELARKHRLYDHHIVQLAPGTDLDAAKRVLASMPELVESVSFIGGAEQHGFPTSDPLFVQQYPLSSGDQQPGDIGAVRAWELIEDWNPVVVAVVDAGVSADHPDLQGILVPGANFLQCPGGNENTCDRFRLTDDQINSHGTHIAGIIGATTNNNQGIAGVAWSSVIMPVLVLDFFGNGSTFLTANGIMWAADNGADIISVSIGHTENDPFLASAVAYAHEAGSLVIASTGNNANGPVRFPAAYPEVMAVAATDAQDNPAGFNSTGPELSVTAPGVNILSTWDSLLTRQPDTYTSKSGTSFAVPHVAGVAALLLSEAPELNPDELRMIIERTATDLGPEGWDDQFGFGRVCACSAIQVLNDGSAADLDGDGIPDFGLLDIDNNGEVDTDDQHAFNITPTDCNRDGKIDGDDTMFLEDWLRRSEEPQAEDERLTY